MKIVIMYRTALYAEQVSLEIVSTKAKKIVEDFNKGVHIVDDQNKINSYSIINEN